MRILTLIILVFLCALPARVALLGETAEKDKIQDPPTTIKVSMEVKDLPVSIAISRLFVDYGQGDMLNNESLKGIDRKVSANLSNVPWPTAVAMLSQSAGLTYTIIDGKYSFADTPRQYSQVLQAPANSNFNQFRNQQANMANNRNDIGLAKVTQRKKGVSQVFDLTLDQANVFDVIRQLMDLSKREYVIDMGPAADYRMPPPRVTARVSSLSVDEFLNMLSSTSDIQTERLGPKTIIRWRPKWVPGEPLASHANDSYILDYTVLSGLRIIDRGVLKPRDAHRFGEKFGAADSPKPSVVLPPGLSVRPTKVNTDLSGVVYAVSETEVNLEVGFQMPDPADESQSIYASARQRLPLGQSVNIPLIGGSTRRMIQTKGGLRMVDRQAPNLTLHVTVIRNN